MIESACMMLEYLNEKATSERIRKAIAAVILEGKVRTYDMMKMKGSPGVISQGAASTREMGDAVIAKMSKER
jgi:3-isopropylmalate dehydrogenase